MVFIRIFEIIEWFNDSAMMILSDLEFIQWCLRYGHFKWTIKFSLLLFHYNFKMIWCRNHDELTKIKDFSLYCDAMINNWSSVWDLRMRPVPITPPWCSFDWHHYIQANRNELENLVSANYCTFGWIILDESL